MLNNFDQKEVTTLENTMRQNNILPDTIHIQLMDELSKEIKRKQYVKNAINLGELFAVLQL